MRKRQEPLVALPPKMAGAVVSDELAVALKIRGTKSETWQHDRCQETTKHR